MVKHFWIASIVTLLSTAATACPISLFGYEFFSKSGSPPPPPPPPPPPLPPPNETAVKTPTERAAEVARNLFGRLNKLTSAEIEEIVEKQRIAVPYGLESRFESALGLMKTTLANQDGEVSEIGKNNRTQLPAEAALRTLQAVLQHDFLKRTTGVGSKSFNFTIWDVGLVAETVQQLEKLRNDTTALKGRGGRYRVEFERGTLDYIKAIQRRAAASQVRLLLLGELLKEVHEYITAINSALRPRYQNLGDLNALTNWYQNTTITWTIYGPNIQKIEAIYNKKLRIYEIRALAGTGTRRRSLRPVEGRNFSTVYDGFTKSDGVIKPLLVLPDVGVPIESPSS